MEIKLGYLIAVLDCDILERKMPGLLKTSVERSRVKLCKGRGSEPGPPRTLTLAGGDGLAPGHLATR